MRLIITSGACEKTSQRNTKRNHLRLQHKSINYIPGMHWDTSYDFVLLLYHVSGFCYTVTHHNEQEVCQTRQRHSYGEKKTGKRSNCGQTLLDVQGKRPIGRALHGVNTDTCATQRDRISICQESFAITDTCENIYSKSGPMSSQKGTRREDPSRARPLARVRLRCARTHHFH